MGVYESAYNEFTAKYNLNGLDLMKEYEDNRILNGIDDLKFDATSQKKDQNTYLDTLTAALSTYLKEKTKAEKGKTYDMSDFSVIDFMNEFDKVVKAIRTDTAPKKQIYRHTPFAGMSEGLMASRAWNNVKQYNKTLGGLWGDQIRNGTLTLEELQNMTTDSVKMLDSTIKSNIGYTNALKKDLVNVVMARNAMEAAINKRRWTSWLNPANWGPNMRENAYLKELKEKVDAYKNANFPVDNVLPKEFTTRILGNARNELEKTYITSKTEKQTTAEVKEEAQTEADLNKQEENKELNTSVNNENIKENNDIEIPVNEEKEQVFQNEQEFIDVSNNIVNNPNPVVQPVKVEKTNYSEKVNELLDDEEFSDNLLDEMTNVIENMESSLPKARAVRRSLLRVGAFAEIKKAAKNFCERFDDAETPEAKEELVKNTALNVVGIISNNLHSYNLSAKDRFVAAQKMADLMFNQCSPIAFEYEKYAKYGDRYVAKDDRLLNMSIDAQHSSSSDRTIIEDIRKELGVDKSFDGLTEEEKEHQERERRQAEENRIREEKEKSMRQRLENIDKETPDLTTLFGDTERDRQEGLERIAKESPYWRSLQ